MTITMSPFKGGITTEDTTMKKGILTGAPAKDVAVHIPLRLLRARKRLTWQLWLVFDRALSDRIRYCKEHNIPYLAGICEASPDKAVEVLSTKANHYHVEHMMYELLISSLDHIVGKATNGEISGHKYDGPVYAITGERWKACLI